MCRWKVSPTRSLFNLTYLISIYPVAVAQTVDVDMARTSVELVARMDAMPLQCAGSIAPTEKQNVE